MAIHFILQGKGGVGKSYVASLLTQYFLDQKITVVGFDLDPTNPTYAEYEELPVERISLLDANNHIDNEKFVLFGEQLFSHSKDHEIIVDCGTSAYIPMMHFLEQIGFESWLESMGRKTFIHTVLKGGGELSDTYESCSELLKLFPSCPFVIWLNESQQPVTNQGKTFLESQIFQKNAKRIVDVIPLPKYTSGFFGNVDIDRMIENRWTFKECIDGGKFFLVQQRCLYLYRKKIWERLSIFLKNYFTFIEGDNHE